MVIFPFLVGGQMMTVKQLMVREDWLPEHSFKASLKDEMEKEVFLFGQVETVDEITTIVIVTATQILRGHYL